MLEVVVALVIVALILLFLRAGRQNTIVYRKRVASSDEGNSIRDQPSAFSPTSSSDYYADHSTETGHAAPETLAFGGGEFGGGGAGESYDNGTTDASGYEFNNSGSGENDFSSNESDCDSYDSGTSDSGSSDSCSDSSGDSSNCSDD